MRRQRRHFLREQFQIAQHRRAHGAGPRSFGDLRHQPHGGELDGWTPRRLQPHVDGQWHEGAGLRNILRRQVQRRDIDPPAMARQFAGLAALTGPQDAVHMMVAEFDKRRKVVVEGLNKLPGVSCIMPKGAFYAFPNIKRSGWRAKPLANALLDEARLAPKPGLVDSRRGDIRICVSAARRGGTFCFRRPATRLRDTGASIKAV